VGRSLWIALALGLAAAAAYALVRRPPPVAAPPAPVQQAPPSASTPAPDAHPGEPPHADIDEASRTELERILREADERDAAAKRR